jgi:hypothetical protein
MDEAVQRVLTAGSAAGVLEEVFQEPVHDDVKLLGDIVSPLGE